MTKFTTALSLRRLAVLAAIGVVAVACTSEGRNGQNVTVPADEQTAATSEAEALEVATAFVEAYGAFDIERAISYLSDDADISGLGGTLEDLRLNASWFEAMGYRQMLKPCDVVGSSGSGKALRCRYDFHALRSDEIGLGPLGGSPFYLVIEDGAIVRASNSLLNGERFSSPMWEPFARWVSTTYPKDARVMYTDASGPLLPYEDLTDVRRTEQSFRLWERHSREYVKEVGLASDVPEVDYVVDLRTGETTPLPETILRTAGETAGTWPWLPDYGPGVSRYVTSPEGSLLAYVGTGSEATPQIFIAGVDGTGVHQVTHEPIGAVTPAWSPDGTRIAYLGYGSVDAPNIFVLELATGQAKQVTDESPIRPYALQFTPDGSSILYTGGPEVGAELRTVPVTGGKSTLLFDPRARGFGQTVEGSLSPDGSLVTFMGHGIGGRWEPGGAPFLGELGPRLRFVTNADGTDWRSIGWGCSSNPAGTWSPDGSRIVCGTSVKDVVTGLTTSVVRGTLATWVDDHTLLVEM